MTHTPAGRSHAKSVLPNSALGEVLRASWLPLALVTALGAWLRLAGLDHQSFWMDEVLAVVSSRASLRDILTSPPVDPNIPPLYYLLLWALRGLGDGEVALRLPSALAGIASIPLTYAVANAWLGRAVGLASALILAMAPLHVWYSQEARPYALLILLGLLSVRSLQHGLRTPNALLPKIAFAVLGAATFYVHTVAVVFLAALAVYVLIAVPRRDLGRWAGCFGLMALLCLPGAYLLARMPTVSANSSYRFDPSHLAYTLWTYVTGYSLGPNLIELRVDGMASVRRNLGLIAAVLTAVSVLLAHGVVRLWRRDRSALTALGLWAACPVAFGVLGSMMTAHPFNVRYTILALPATLILLAAGITLLPRTAPRRAALVLVVGISAASLWNYRTNPRYYRDDNRGAAAFLRRHAAPGDLVIASAAYTRLPLRHYLGDSKLQVVGYPMAASGASDSASLGATFVQPGRLDADVPRLVGGRPAFWLFLSRTFHSDPDGLLQQYADTHYERTDRFAGPGVEVLRYVRPGANGDPGR